MTDMIRVDVLSGLSALAGRYSAIICDIWGVVHDGKTAFRPACEALSRFRAAGKAVLLLSNAPRPGPAVQEMLDRLDVPREAYDAILTSGDMTRAHLREKGAVKLFHLGPERDLPLYDGIKVERAGPENAELIVCTGLFDDELEVAEDYRARLSGWRDLGLPMLCANPDIVVERGPRLISCAGAVAEIYQGLGGQVTYFGKPHGPAYRAAFHRLGELAGGRGARPANILAIGDAIATDLKGAARSGIDALFVAGGIHAALAGTAEAFNHQGLATAFAAADVRPAAMMWRLSW